MSHFVLQQIVDAKENFAEEAVYGDLNNALTLVREWYKLKTDLNSVGKVAVDICRLNPQCCRDPGACRPKRVTSLFS